ncbi:hypothetical protein EJ08DRAFT_645170 [Tothia fuscella]|uniref:Uncharacterized protein n=1 Tax=Tothia fuscella TaxID=1048955 RepID=A0A9P4P2N9_9PEZI|nr:hypothetical protein EJ08DRAFT_645170 [Tothia fuscella]
MSNTKNGTTSTAQAELPTRKKKAAKKANPPNSKSPEPALPAPLSVEEIRTNAAAGPALKSPTPPALQPSKKKRKRAENELPANEPAVKISAVALSPVPAAPTPPTQKMESRKRRKVTSPPIDEPIAASVESPAREAPIKESRERKKRKSKVVQQPQLTPDTSGPEGDSEDVKPVVKAKKSKKASKANGSSAIGQKTGAYSKEEFQALDAAIASIRKEHNLTPKEMCEIIQANGNELSKHAKAPPNFWADIASALPDRPRQSIQKCARRKYTNAQKHSGWNSEEDEEVREAYALYPGKWKLIGEAVGRFHEEVRYRWRDYIEPGTARVEDVWTGEEEELFEKLTGEMRDKARKEHAQNVRTGKASGEFDEAAFKPAFQPLSKMMKTRNRLQCSNKWKNMQLQLAKEKESSEDSPSSLRDNKPSARTLQAYNDFDKKMQMGDKLDCLKQTLEGVKRYKIKKEKRIPWGEIKKANMTSRWQTVDRKVVFEKFKVLASVAADTVPQEALEIIIRYIEDKYTKAALNKRYDGQKQVRSPRPKTSPRRKSTKSKATVSDSDSDDEEHGDEDEDEDTPAPPPRKKVAKAPVKKVASEKASPAKATTSDSSTATTSDSDSTKTSNTSSESS